MTPTNFDARRRAVLCASGILSLGFLASCNTARVLMPETGTGSDQTAAVLGAINALRSSHGLSALVVDPNASKAAIDQAGRMARAGKMEHNIGFGADFAKRMKGQGVQLPAAENIASGQADAVSAYDAWYRSPKHLANMLGKPYRGLGVAVMRNPASDNRPYWAMVLSG